MKLTLATAMGTCFGVQEAIDLALQPALRGRLTIVGELVHNPQTVARLLENGVRMVGRDQLDAIDTPEVMVTAHGADDGLKAELRRRGFTVHDATCPLVLRLHKLARFLEGKGYRVVVIGEARHVEIQGVIGNLERGVVIGSAEEAAGLAGERRLGVVAQTTARSEQVEAVLAALRALPGVEELRFCDTICQPVKDRQQAIRDLLTQDIDLGIVVGGRNSSNTARLREVFLANGIEAHHIEGPDDLDRAWLVGKTHIGLTAGTSTPPEVIEAVRARFASLDPCRE